MRFIVKTLKTLVILAIFGAVTYGIYKYVGIFNTFLAISQTYVIFALIKVQKNLNNTMLKIHQNNIENQKSLDNNITKSRQLIMEKLDGIRAEADR